MSHRSFGSRVTLFVPFFGGAVLASLMVSPHLHAQAAPCTYDACALSLIPRLGGLDVVRGNAEQRVGSLGFVLPRDVRPAFTGNAAAQAHAARAQSIRRVAAVLTDAGGILAAAGLMRALSSNGRRTSLMVAAGGLALVGASVPPQFAADAELSRAVREYNRQFAGERR